MALSTGTRFGPYEVTALLGVGGMGEVFLATDTNLKRDVAIKALPATFAADADRVARLQREAELLAALNHPNIAQIYGLERSGGTVALVMELVDGPTLAERIAQAPLPLDEGLPIALQIASALEAAHARGIVHRDLKPANVKLAADGSVKVLDFGIAKMLGPMTGGLTTVPGASVTQSGMVLGSPGYMSPEQAAGRPVDERADIWAFGCVLYEMLTGQRPIGGGDADLGALPQTLPLPVRQALALCLQREPKRRLADIRDVRLVLDGAFAADAPAEAPSRRRQVSVALAGLVLGGVAVGLVSLALRPDAEPQPVTRFSTPISVALPEISIADDGAQIAFWSGSPQQIYVRALDEIEARPVAGTADATAPPPPPPCFSPDGQWLAFSADGLTRLKKVPITGGTALAMAEGLETADFCDWGEDGHIYFGTDRGIERVADVGGQPEVVVAPSGERSELNYELPSLLPGSSQLLFTLVASGNIQVALADLATRDVEILLEDAGFATFAATGADGTRGHLLFGRNGALIAAPFDPSRRRLGALSPVADGIAETGPFTFAVVSRNGTLAYVAGNSTGSGDATLTWVDRQGIEQSLPEVPAWYGEVSLSPDGRHAALTIIDPATFNTDLYLYEIEANRLARLTFDEPGVTGVRANIGATWTPDGQRIIYFRQDQVTMIGSGLSELRSVPIDGSAPPTTLVPAAAWPTRRLESSSISPDGRVLLGTARNSNVAAGDIWMLSPTGELGAPSSSEAAPSDFVQTSFNERYAAFSPDGRFVAYTSDESGRDEIYVVPFGGSGGKAQVSRNGGTLPRWNPRGGELFFLATNALMAVDVATEGAFRAGTPHVLFTTPPLLKSLGRYYDVAPDGSRFLMIKVARAAQQSMDLRVVLNWFEEVKRLAPPAR